MPRSLGGSHVTRSYFTTSRVGGLEGDRPRFRGVSSIFAWWHRSLRLATGAERGSARRGERRQADDMIRVGVAQCHDVEDQCIGDPPGRISEAEPPNVTRRTKCGGDQSQRKS